MVEAGARGLDSRAWPRPSTRPSGRSCIVAHSLGVPTAIQAIPQFSKPVAGAFFVAPPDVANPDDPAAGT